MDQVVDLRGPPCKKNGGGGCPSDILKRASKRYQFPILWAWSRVTNSKTTHLLSYFFAQYTERYRVLLRCGIFQAEHLKRFQTAFSTPKTSIPVFLYERALVVVERAFFSQVFKLKRKQKSTVNDFI